MATAASHTSPVADSHLLRSTLDRETGFEIVHASVPPSRSAMMRLIVAKIATRTWNCVASGAMTFVIGSIGNGAWRTSPAATGTFASSQFVIAAFAAVSV